MKNYWSPTKSSRELCKRHQLWNKLLNRCVSIFRFVSFFPREKLRVGGNQLLELKGALDCCAGAHVCPERWFSLEMFIHDWIIYRDFYCHRCTSAFICKSVYFTVYSIQLSELRQPVFSDRIFITLLLHLRIPHPIEFQSHFWVLVNIL